MVVFINTTCSISDVDWAVMSMLALVKWAKVIEEQTLLVFKAQFYFVKLDHRGHRQS